jgi:hypothetical protein
MARRSPCSLVLTGAGHRNILISAGHFSVASFRGLGLEPGEQSATENSRQENKVGLGLAMPLRLPRSIVVSLLSTSVALALVSGGLWWITWPSRTALGICIAASGGTIGSRS